MWEVTFKPKPHIEKSENVEEPTLGWVIFTLHFLQCIPACMYSIEAYCSSWPTSTTPIALQLDASCRSYICGQESVTLKPFDFLKYRRVQPWYFPVHIRKTYAKCLDSSAKHNYWVYYSYEVCCCVINYILICTISMWSLQSLLQIVLYKTWSEFYVVCMYTHLYASSFMWS